jgi:hypothetical protein
MIAFPDEESAIFDTARKQLSASRIPGDPFDQPEFGRN